MDSLTNSKIPGNLEKINYLLCFLDPRDINISIGTRQGLAKKQEEGTT